MGHFQLFSRILKFSMGHFLSFYTDFYGPFSKLMGLWRMAPCLPNHCNDQIIFTINRNALPPTVWNMARLKFWCQTDYCLEYRLVNRHTFAFRFTPCFA